MADPQRVRELVAAMQDATKQPVTVKHRIGIDGRESYEELRQFVEIVNERRPDRFTVHARIAILAGLSPKENRNVPPIRYQDVYRLKNDLPDLQIELNGHVKTPDEIAMHLKSVDAVMVGRAAYDDPWSLSTIDQRFLGADSNLHQSPTRAQVIEAMAAYISRWSAAGWPERNVLRHMLGLFGGVPGTRKYKQRLSGPLSAGEGVSALQEAVASIPEDALHAGPQSAN